MLNIEMLLESRILHCTTPDLNIEMSLHQPKIEHQAAAKYLATLKKFNKKTWLMMLADW